MKRLVLTLMGVVLASVSVMAQTPAAAPAAAKPAAVTAAPVATAPAAAATPVKAVDTSKALTGTVDSVTAADAAKSVAAKVMVTDEAGLKYLLTVKDTTTIYNDRSEAISLDKIVAGQKVHVKYNGANNEAVSIRVAHSAASSAAPSVTP